MVLVRALWWLITLPFRLAFWLIGLVLWVLFLPVRLLFAVLGLIGFGRLIPLALIGALGYVCYRLVSEPAGQEGGGTPGTAS